MTSVSNERLSFEDNYDPHSVDSGIEFLKMFLKEKWEPQMEMCRIVSDKVTLSSLMDIGKETSKEGVPKCRNLIECPGLNDAIAISLWEFLSGSVPSPDDLLQDDDTSVVSLEFVERFIIVREKPPKDTAVVNVQQVEEVEPVEEVQGVQEVQPVQPVQQDLQVQTVQQVQQVDRSQPPSRTSRRQTFSASKSAGSPRQGRVRRVQSASFFLRDMIPRLRDWGRRQAEALNETGIAMGRGLGSQPYNDDYVELRIFILKALNQLGRTAASGVIVMQRFQG
jgi:hypothetical protein